MTASHLPSLYGAPSKLCVWLLQLVRPGELTPGILASEYAARRETLVNALPQGSMAIIAAALGQFMTGNIPYPYRQVSFIPQFHHLDMTSPQHCME